MTAKEAREALQRLEISENKRSQSRGYYGPSAETETQMASLQLAAEGTDLGQFKDRKAYNTAVSDRVAANREARGPMAFSTAEGRLIPWDPVTRTRRDQTPATPLTQSQNLNFPITEGGTRGMDREAISEKARAEAARLGGNQVFGLTAQPTNFETAGVKKESGGVIQTPYGIMSTSAPVGQKEFESRMNKMGSDRSESYTMTPSGNFQRQFSGAEDRALVMAGMAEKGAAIRSRLDQESIQRGYAFRQGLAESEAQRAMTPSFGTTVGREGTMRGAQATIEAERWKQARGGRSPMSQEPLAVRGMDFRRGSMGEFAPVRGFGDSWQANFMGGGGPQPAQASLTAQATPTAPTSSFWQTAYNGQPSEVPSLQPTAGLISGTNFGSTLAQNIEDPLERFKSFVRPTRVARNRSPIPFGMRG
jgi:hypothetical protein